ncbi:hypothetical protein N8267_01420 [Pelagibacteraceae bacterium]|nr:hypothetical protein [Pelagibacteraceae bacterium]
MKRLLLIFILVLSFQSLTKADDISDFQVEGMSIGDSLLEFKTKKFIFKKLEDSSTFYYKNKKYAVMGLSINSENYDAVSATIKPKDKDFIIYAIEGRIKYNNNNQDCLDKKKQISKEILTSFPKKKYQYFDGKHNFDKKGNSLYYSNILYLSGGNIELYCFDWSNEITITKGMKDELKVIITESNFKKWVNTNAWK